MPQTLPKPDAQIPPSAAPQQGFKPGDHVVLVDGSGYIFRAFHALPPLTRRSDGLPVGAVSGFCNMLWKLLREPVEGKTPTHLAVIFDASPSTFRNQIYDAYKATRSEPPDDLKPQFGLIREAVRAFNVSCIEQDGFEADDIIATYARMARDAGASAVIASSDKDLMQIVGDGVVMYDSMKDRLIGRAEVIERFGVPPEKVIEVQALAGDSIDNVPGVPGIGVKTAAQLINEYGDLDTLLERAAEIRQPKRREALIENADKARLSRRLVTLDLAVPLACPPDMLAVEGVDGPRLIAFLKAMEFNALTRRVAEVTGTEAAEIEPSAKHRAAASSYPQAPIGDALATASSPLVGEGREGVGPASATQGKSGEDPLPYPPPRGGRGASGLENSPQALAAARAAEAANARFEPAAYETVTDIERLETWVWEAIEQGHVAIAAQMGGPNPLSAQFTGLSLALEPGRAAYVPLRHRAGEGLELDGAPPAQIGCHDALDRLRLVFEDRSVLKIGHDLKPLWHALRAENIDLTSTDDVMLLSYVLDAGRGGHDLDSLSDRWFGHKPLAFTDVAGTGRKKIGFGQVALDRATAYAAGNADLSLRLWRALKPRLVAEGLLTVYETLERPMTDVLARLEARGIAIDRTVLSRLSGEFAQSSAALEAEIHVLAGGPFQVGSPAQVGEVLFGRLGLPGGTKTKTGAWATRATQLEELAEAGHDLPRRIVSWRQLTKLKQTYTDALVAAADPETGRVHTTYQLAATSTGRLSSTDPNLQNIPIRTEEGRKIRRAFVASPGHKIISADYSQIELRLLAHYADIAPLKTAFAEGIDIHAMTAAEVFGVPLENMDPNVRRNAKTINFGIIYGISAFGLSSRLGIPREEAGAYIKLYFERFPGIRDYMDRMKAMAREKGYVTTLFGRRCHYPDIKISNPSIRQFNERAAINAPLQGTAADIIRRAMLRMDRALEEARLETRMLLSVHDELVFEAPDAEVEAALPVIREVMVGAPLPAVALSVPLAVDARAAGDWDGAH